ncbi:hypothetical protein HMI55_002020, partial [Coelomomyces lativittatus]
MYFTTSSSSSSPPSSFEKSKSKSFQSNPMSKLYTLLKTLSTSSISHLKNKVYLKHLVPLPTSSLSTSHSSSANLTSDSMAWIEFKKAYPTTQISLHQVGYREGYGSFLDSNHKIQSTSVIPNSENQVTAFQIRTVPTSPRTSCGSKDLSPIVSNKDDMKSTLIEKRIIDDSITTTTSSPFPSSLEGLVSEKEPINLSVSSQQPVTSSFMKIYPRNVILLTFTKYASLAMEWKTNIIH